MSIEKEWIVQRCINAFQDEYEDWAGYCEKLMSQAEMKKALDECNQKWPMHEFRGHRVVAIEKHGAEHPGRSLI